MDFTSELLARLQKGESVENLASELTKAINDANTQNERLKAEAEAKRKADKEAAAKNKDKIDAINALLRAVEQIVIAWDLGDDVLDFVDELDADDIVQEIDKAVPAVRAYAQLLDELADLREARPVSDTPKKVQHIDPIEDFLDKFVR